MSIDTSSNFLVVQPSEVSLSFASGLEKITQPSETVGYRELQLHRATAATG